MFCVAGLQSEGNQTDGNESTLIRCNCCYNLPVHRIPNSAEFQGSLLQMVDVTSCFLSPGHGGVY